MIKSKTVVDEVAVKKFNEEQRDWTATCRVCKQSLTGSLADLRAHMEKCHGKSS